MQTFAVAQQLRGLPGVPSRVIDYMQGEKRSEGSVIEVKGWFQWSDKAKLKWMRGLVNRYAQDPEMNTFVAQNVFRSQGIAPRDYPTQAAAILKWVQNPQNVYYVNERKEIIRTPWRVIRDKTGDCDDMAILIATFAETIALPWRFVLAGKHRGKPFRAHEHERFPWGAEFSHIYVEVGFPPFSSNPTWVSMEPTIQNAPLGYDVVKNGYVTDRNGAAQVPELAGAFGVWGSDALPSIVEERHGFVGTLIHRLNPRDVLVSAIELLVIGAVATALGNLWKRFTRRKR